MLNPSKEYKHYKDSADAGLSFLDKKINKPKLVEEPKKETKKMDLISFIPDSHLLKRMAIQLSFETNLPINTVFLMGLGVVGSMACRVFCTSYEYGSRLPIGLYVVAEQPPGAAKSWCLHEFQAPFYEIDRFQFGDNKPRLFLTNTTSEGLEKTLPGTAGFFSAVSSEQGLFNSLFGLSYSGKDRANNNDIVLSGFDGGFVSSSRVTREGYTGRVGGGVVCFAQNGSVESILQASGGTGISERFLMIAEGHNLGKRDHTKKHIHDRELINDYKSFCSFYDKHYEIQNTLDSLIDLEISQDGFKLINEYRNTIEPLLEDGAKYSHSFLRGAAGKINIQIMKIASILHIMSDSNGMVISNDTIKASIGIADALLGNTYAMCGDKEVFGIESEDSAIISYLERSSKPKTVREIINSLRTTKPFKDMSTDKSKAIRKAVEKMAENKKLTVSFDQNGRELYSVT